MQDLVQIVEETFIGMNDRYPSQNLTKGIFALIQNAIIDQGRIAKRKGTNPVAASLGSFDILGGNAYQPVAGTKYLIVNRNGSSNAQLYSWAGSGSFSAIGSANLT